MSRLINPILVNETKWPRLLAVDIGKKGGLVANCGITFVINRMPQDNKEYAYMVRAINPSVVIAEDVHVFGAGFSMQAQASLLEQKGVLRGICASQGIALEFLEPSQWIQAYTTKKSKDFKNKNDWKKHLAEKANALLPKFYHMLDTWTADAFLIWNYYASVLVNDRLPNLTKVRFQ